jgi:hypothetical protein
VRRRLLQVHAYTEEASTLQKYFHNETANAVKAVVAEFGEFTTFQKIAEAIGYSHEFVRQRLGQDPNVCKVGKRYRVPKATAARFVTDLLTSEQHHGS